MRDPASFLRCHVRTIRSAGVSRPAWTAPVPPIDDRYRPWLTDSGSLSARISTRCGALRVRRVFQGLRRPGHDEASLIELSPGRNAHVREVVLLADEVPVVFAHSIVSPRDLRGPWRCIGRLGERPLSTALFENPRVRRGALEYRRLDRRHPLHARLRELGLGAQHALWARRSSFRLEERPLLVTEVFLPALLALDRAPVHAHAGPASRS